MRLSALFFAVCLAPGPLAAEIPVRGLVTDDGGVPVDSARIELRRASTRFERDLAECCTDAAAPLPSDVASSGADGRFLLSAPEAGLYRVTATALGKLAQERTIGPIVEAKELETAVLERSIALTLTVVDPAGRPAPGAQVRVSFVGHQDRIGTTGRNDAWRPRDRGAVTGADGTAVVPVGENEVVRVSASLPGRLEATEDRLILLTRKTLRLRLGVSHMLEVRDGEAEPVVGALVRLGRTPLGLTGHDGRLRIVVPERGRTWFSAETASGSFGQVELEAPARADSPPGVLVLTKPETLSGRVNDRSSGRSLQDAWVVSGDTVTRTGSAGAYALPVLKSRSLRVVRAVAVGYLEEAAVIGDGRGHWELEQDLALRLKTPLRGRVIDEERRPVAGAEISMRETPVETARISERSPVELLTGYIRRPRFARSRADGSFSLSAAAESDYELEVRKESFLPTRLEASPEFGEEILVLLRRGRQGVGQVLDLDERPVAGALVRLWPARDDTDGIVRDQSSWETTTDEEGHFELHEIEPGPCDLRVTASGFAPLFVEGLNVVFDVSDPEVDLGTIVLEPGLRITGQVVGPRGRPVAGAKVAYEFWSAEGDLKPWELETAEVTTGEEGYFAVEDLLAGEKLDLHVWQIDYAASEARGVEVPTEDLVIELEPTAVVRGRVVGPGSAALADAWVTASYQALHGGTQTQSAAVGTDGRFELPHLGTRRAVVRADATGYRERRVWLDLEPGEVLEGLVLELKAGSVIEGTVLGSGGEPVAGVRVAPMYRRRPNEASDPTDAAGRFRLTGLELGPQKVNVLPRELPATSRLIEVKPGVNTVEIRLEEGFVVSGYVVDRERRPVPSARVEFARETAATGEDGAFELDSVPRGVHRLQVDKKGFAPHAIGEVRVDGSIRDLEIVIDRGGTITGYVRGLETAAYSRVQVWASSLEDEWAAGRVDFDGRYRLGPLPAGKWRLGASDESSGRSARGSIELTPGLAEAELDLEFVRALSIAGEVYLDGEPISGGGVRLRGIDVVTASRTRTDYSGSFRFEGLSPGRYRLTFRGPGRGLLEVREIELSGDEQVLFELASGQLRGRTLDAADASALESSTVKLEPLGTNPSGASISTLTDSVGRFQFSRLAEGPYLLKARHEGYGLLERRLDVRAGPSGEELDLALERTTGLVLDVRDAAGGLPEVVWVAAFAGEPAAGEPAVAGRFIVTAEGTARLTSLPSGSWSLLVRAPGSGTVRLSASAPGEVAVVRLPPATRLEVMVSDLVGSDELAKVTIAGAQGPFVSVTSGGVRREWRAGGSWSVIEGLPPGNWEVVVSGNGRSWSGRAVAPPGGGSVQLEL